MSRDGSEAGSGEGGGLAPVRQWRIHVGAHKTATTHLQQTLAALRDDLAGQGVDFIPTPRVRTFGLAALLRRRPPLARLPVVGGAYMRAAIEARLAPLRIGPEVVAVSEENILGMPSGLIAAPFYPAAPVALERLATLARGAEVVLFLSIRSYDTIVPSAYVEMLKHVPPSPGGFRAACERVLARPPSWLDLVSRLRTAAPGAPVRVWRQEDYRANARAILGEVCGRPLGTLPRISDPTLTRSPSAAAIATVEALPGGLPPEERRVRVRAIFAAAEPGADRFQPLASEERQRLRGLYEADLERIEREHPGVLMQFARDGSDT